MMDQLIARFPAQLEEALEIAKQAKLREYNPITRVFVTGLGGSGIGGNFVAEFIRNDSPIPYIVGKSYDIPRWIGPETLAIVSSYSGNTEETLSAYEKLKISGAQIIVVASGGALIENAQKDGYDFIQLPNNWPSPRACLGFSMVQQLGILTQLGIIPSHHLEQIASASKLIAAQSETIREKAEKIAGLLHGKTPVIYTTDRCESVAVRFRQQINENAKMLCWHHVIPEMNHNELVGWRDRRDDLAVVFLRFKDDFERTKTRIEINKEIISHYTNTNLEIYPQGESLIEQAIYHVHLGDWISWYLAGLHGVDAVEVRVIDFLKDTLSKS